MKRKNLRDLEYFLKNVVPKYYRKTKKGLYISDEWMFNNPSLSDTYSSVKELYGCLSSLKKSNTIPGLMVIESGWPNLKEIEEWVKNNKKRV